METTVSTLGGNLLGKGLSIWWIIIVCIILIVIFVVAAHNGLIKLREAVKEALSDVDAQMQLRFDLVENLVNTVKGYAIHEKETLTQVIQARNMYMNAKTEWEKFAANDQLTGVLKTLFAVSESYPDLKANQNFLQLQSELSDIENKIAAARRFYNSSVKDYNTAIGVFPKNIVAKLFGFNEYDFFQITDEAAKKAPKVKF